MQLVELSLKIVVFCVHLIKKTEGVEINDEKKKK